MRNKWKRKLRCFGTFVLMLSCLCFHRTISACASPAERGTIQIDVKVEDKKGNRVGIENVKFASRTPAVEAIVFLDYIYMLS